MKNVYHFTYMGTSPLISHPLQVTKVTYVRTGRAPHSNKYLWELLLLCLAGDPPEDDLFAHWNGLFIGS